MVSIIAVKPVPQLSAGAATSRTGREFWTSDAATLSNTRKRFALRTLPEQSWQEMLFCAQLDKSNYPGITNGRLQPNLSQNKTCQCCVIVTI